MADLGDAVRKSRLAGLEALRDELATTIQGDDGKQTAALARQLREALREIDELKRAVQKGSRVDELADRRKARVADAAGGDAAERSGSERRT